MNMYTKIVDNGVNTEALLGAREELTEAPEGAIRAACLVVGFKSRMPGATRQPCDIPRALFGTAKSRILEAMKKLRRRFEEDGAP